jgi:hypothetical protein
MSSVDWSKAPEWAGAVVQSDGGTGSLYWVMQYGGKSPRQRLEKSEPDTDFIADMLNGSAWVLVESRPSTAWTGQGLPPVGVACEYMRGDVPHISQDWEKVVPLAFGSKLAFLRYAATGNEFTEKVCRCAFRPIRTQAQIAADERTKECDRIYGILSSVERPGNKSDMAEELYDADYRKQPTKQDGE